YMSKKKKKDRKTQPQAATVPEKKIIPAAPGLRFNLGVLVFFFLYAFLLYANSLHSPFIWDDKYLITDNHLIKSLRYIPDIFKHHLYYSTAGTSSFYRPLQTIFLILDHALSKNNVIGYHITSIIFHVFCAFFIYLNISALFKRKFIAFMVGLLFLVHPINSTVVNYISSRADSQVTLFVLISVYLFIKYNFIKSLGSKNLTNGPAVRQGHGLPGQSFGRELPSLFYLFGSLFSFILALLSKELGIILPFLILVIIPFISNNEQDKNSDKEQKESFDRFCVFKKVLPYFTVWSIYGVLRFTILKFQSGGGVSFPPLYIRLLTTAESFVRLIVSLFLPLKIHIEKSIPFSQGFSQPSTFFCLIIMIGLAIFIYWVRTRSRICFWGLIWFFVALLPMANIVPINTTLTDHWLYLPCLGLFVSVIGGTADLIKKADLTRQRL
ncbi:MAG: hypothetical protein KAV18_04970, partial [Candidatus Omnitrophica bacterium]|nr:hypothetical protein [Candidatus Omnitrophota bacterium]